jgi:cell wall-associated NlpC family hydrolase
MSDLQTDRRNLVAQRGNGRHRADVEINVLESFELRSRRSIREAEKARLSRAERRAAKKAAKQDALYFATTPEVSSPNVIRAPKKLHWFSRRQVRNTITMAISSGLFATFSLPAYAFNPDVAAMARFTTTSAQELANGEGTQNLTVAAVNTVKFVRGTYADAKASEIEYETRLTNYRTYTGPTAADFLANPKYTVLDGAKILEVAAKYVGTPYVFGGETPAGFDCSGYVAFVFAQFGVAMPHSVHGQNRMGVLVKPQDAQPGDLVIFNDLSHDGIYAGNGNFYHAPRRGDNVKLAPIYTPNVHFVRILGN